jgi:hypothetical protein
MLEVSLLISSEKSRYGITSKTMVRFNLRVRTYFKKKNTTYKPKRRYMKKENKLTKEVFTGLYLKK